MKIIFVLLSVVIYFNSYAINITNFQFTKTTYEKYEKAEATFKLSINYSNPYNTDVVQADAIIMAPDSSMITMPCFYFIPEKITANYGTTEDLANASWMLRFAPTETGTYSIKIMVVDTTGGTYYSATTTINIIAGSRKGFVKIDNDNKQFLRFDNGSPYYPIGFDLCWNDGSGADFYNYYMNKMGTNKVTWMRYWMTDFARQALEWSSSHWSGWYQGLGIYSQKPAALLDSVLSLCEANGIYLQLTMQHHGQFSSTSDAEWSDNPYNTANGGFLTNAGDFFASTQAKLQTKKLYRYIIARYGYSTNIFAWELFNEVDLTDGTSADIVSWHKEMNLYIKSLDIYQHIVTTSISGDEDLLRQLDDSATLTQLQYHLYQDYLEKGLHVTAERIKSNISKPVMCGEFGTSTSYDNCNHPDNWGDHIRKGAWIGLMTAAPNMFWFWDTYIDCKNLYSVYKTPGDFFDTVDIVRETQGIYQSYIYAYPVDTPAMLSAVGGLGWTTSLQDSFVVDAQGNFPGIDNLSCFIQGDYHASMGRKAVFTLTFSGAGTAYFDAIGTYSSTQTIQVFIDGVLTTTYNVLQTGGTFSVAVPAGTHTIRYYNSGTDWVNVAGYRFIPVKIPKAINYGYCKNNNAYGFIYDQTYGQWADSSAVNVISGVVLKIGPLNPGNYKVDFINTISGIRDTSSSILTTLNDTITVPIPDFKKDIAFKVYPANVNVAEVLISNNFINVYPNPFGDNIKFEIKYDIGKYAVEIYNLQGEHVYSSGYTDAKELIIPRNYLASGMYFYKFFGKSGLIGAGKLIAD